MRKIAVGVAMTFLTGCALTPMERITACRAASVSDACWTGRAYPFERGSLHELQAEYAAHDAREDGLRKEQGKPPRIVSCDEFPPIEAFLLPEGSDANQSADPACAYRLRGVRPYRAISGGYLVTASSADPETGASGVIFTDAAWPLGQIILGGHARYVGQGYFDGTSGRRRRVPMFLEVAP
jgi:hypothetical protein